MKEPTQKAREICEMYHSGMSANAIARHYNNQHSVIFQYLKRWYAEIYGSFSLKRDIKETRLAEIKQKFDKLYVPRAHSRKYYYTQIGCTSVEFYYMLKKYNIKFPRLCTYKNQKTLCNVPEEEFNEIQDVAKQLGISMRELACRAINEYLLNHDIK